MLIRVIRAIRQKPKEVRNQYALGIAGGFSLIVFLIWVTHLPAVATDVASVDVVPDESAGAFSSLINEAKEQFSTATEEFNPVTATSAPVEQQIDMSIVDSIPPAQPTIQSTTTADAPAVRIATTTTGVGQ